MRQYCLLMLLLVAVAPLSAAQQREDPGKTYTGAGAGHFIVAVSEDGQFITLEDKSRWDIDPAATFRTMHWQLDANISVRRADPGSAFAYTLHNLDLDEGAGAHYLPR